MINDDSQPSSEMPQSPAGQLQRLADMLGHSVETFTDGARDPLNTKNLSELITIWVEMDDDDKRDRLLEFARQLAMS